MSLTHALKWSFLSELASKAISPIVFVVLARLLTPEDFGVMSSALMVISFSQIFWEAGMGKALIQRQTDTDEAANVAFWINICLGVVIASLLFITSEPIALTFFHDVRVTAVIQVMTIQVFFGAVSSVHTALLQKEMGFKKLFWVRFATVSLPGLASIPLAWNGMGYWALVVGTLVGQAAQVVMLWNMSLWRPKLTFNFQVAQELVRFGAWVGTSGLLAWFFIWADSLIVGMYLGTHDLGLYRTGNQFATMIYTVMFGPVTPVLYSYLVQINNNKQGIGEIAKKVYKILTVIAIPVAIIVFFEADLLANTVFGGKWQGIGLVIGVMSLMHGYSWVVGMDGEYYRAIGKPSYETIVTTSTLFVYLAIYLYSIQFGFEAFIWTRLGLAISALFFHLLLARKILCVPIKPIITYLFSVSLISGISVYLIKYLVMNNNGGSLPKLIISLFLSIVFLALLFFLFERNGVLKDIISITKKKSI
jgi:O-antigen/teichoic acid export membrane protein